MKIRRLIGLNLSAILGIAMLIGSPTLGSAGTYTFDFNNLSNFEATGVLTTDASNNIITMTGTVTGTGGGAISFTSGSGSDAAFTWDNVLIPNADPQLDTFGLVFVTPTYEYNVWGNSPGNYSYYAATPIGTANYISGDGPPQVTVTITEVAAVPEPSTWAMMVLGFAGVGFMAYRRKNNKVSFRVA